MTIQQLRAKPNTPKRKHALPLPIPLRLRAKTNPNPYDLIRALLPQIRQSGLHPRTMNLYLPARQPIQSPQNPPKRRQMGEKSTKFPSLTPQKAATPKAKAQPNGWKWLEMGGNKKTPAPNPPKEPTRTPKHHPPNRRKHRQHPPIAPPQIQPQNHPRRHPPPRGTAESPQQALAQTAQQYPKPHQKGAAK